MKRYLAVSDYIDWQHPDVLAKARVLSQGLSTPEAIAKQCFEFVRDEIKHSIDYALNPVTCKASDVLKHQTGYCYAKSHLLAALLRANGIATGLCYQRLTLQNDEPPFTLHGLNAVFLADIGWYRIDARGNKQGVDAQFNPPVEQLAFAIKTQGEADFLEIWPEPLPLIVDVLTQSDSVEEVLHHLPDIEVVQRLV
ncbi:MAG: transglutaminase family protein [Mariprofundaceae bacterium]|nr:transglutaminase family protein [Mariprofundaceae bacterium]